MPDGFARFLAGDTFLLLVFGLTVVEAALLVVLHARTGRGPAPSRALPFLGAGAAFVLALLFHRRADGSGALPFAMAMGAAFVLHLIHLRALTRPS